MTPRIALLISLAVAALPGAFAQAATPYVPAVLEPWRAWVMAQHEDQPCPPLYTDAAVRPCTWLQSLEIEAQQDGARFAIDVELFATTEVILPASAGSWPTDVEVDGRPAVVTRSDGRPRLRLAPGRYAVTGTLAWSALPDALSVPRNHGLLRLTVDGRPVAQPLLEGERLWLGRAAAPGTAASTDSLEVRVYRRFNDGVPATIETTLDLSVSGSHRIETLGRALPEGFAVTDLNTPLPARLDPDGNLRIQVEPGDWRVTLRARALAPVTALTMAATTDSWPDQEIWGFAAARGLRVVTIEGASPIDLSQTQAPFQDIPGYLVTPDSEFRITEQFRGDPNPAPNDYGLARQAWLAFDGDSFVLEDRIDVTAAQPARLAAAFVPGRVTVDGVPQLVTTVDGGAPGIEIPQGRYQVVAASEVERGALEQALGWQIDASSVRTTLHLPPAWRLLWARGVDHAPTAWLSQWNVWNLFLVLITVIAAGRLLGAGSALLAAATLTVVYHEPGSPAYAWIVMLTLLAAARVSRAGLFRSLLGLLYFAVLAVTVVSTVNFAIDGFRKALYPQLERPAEVVEQFAAPTLGMDAAMDAEMNAEMLMSKSGAPGEIAVVEDGRAARPRTPAPAPPPARDLYPADLKVQTGPALPQWRWTEAPLAWDGPVTADQPLAIALAPPWLTRTLYVVGPLLLLGLLGVFALANLPAGMRLPTALARFTRPQTAAAGPVAPVALLMLLGGLLGGVHAAPAVAAELPTPELLTELERRLTAPPACMPGCANVERMRVRLDGQDLSLEIVVHADEAVAVPLLQGDQQWHPVEALSGGQPATVRRDDDGRLLMALAAGRHTLELSGPVAHLDRFELSLPMTPGRIELDVRDWQVYGMEEGRLRGDALQFAREVQGRDARSTTSLRSDPVTPYYAIERELHFGLEWRAFTTIRRIAPAAGVVPFSVPLMPGESVLSGLVTTTGGRATGVLAPDQQLQTYESTLAFTDLLKLEAPPLAVAAERWTLVPSNLWHLEHAGVPPTKTAVGEAPGPRFHPLPGETLTLTLTRPVAVPGDSITVERMDLSEEPGKRTRRATLVLDLLSSQGGTYPLTLPEGARILEIRANGRPEPIPLAQESIPLPVVPGSQTLSVTWEAPLPVATRTVTSTPAVPGVARNISINLALPADRWPLLVGGPALGPAVTYWSILLLVLIVAVALARVPGLPLSTTDAVLAGIGMSFCNLPGTVIAGVWLLVMLARRRAADRLATVGRTAFRLLQSVLALFSVIAVLALAASVPYGLLGAPDMHIAGNGSSAHSLHWFQDHANAGLPEAWVVSLPLWIYRVAMLAWSLWLAFALVRWVRWAWDAYSAGGAWRQDERGMPPQTTPDSVAPGGADAGGN